MSTMSAQRATTPRPPLPLLANGDRMTQKEFHRRYEQYPEDVKFELIGGIVYLAPPVTWSHGTYSAKLSFVHYEAVGESSPCGHFFSISDSSLSISESRDC